MINPFKKISSEDKENDRIKKMYKDNISSQAWVITKKTLSKSLVLSDVTKLEKMYQTYFKKYPDVKSEANAIKRISQLKTMCK